MMYQTSENSQLLRRVFWSLKHHSTQPILIVNRENPQNSEAPNDPKRGLDLIALILGDPNFSWIIVVIFSPLIQILLLSNCLLTTAAKLKPVAMNESAAGKSTATAPRRSLACSLNPFVWQMKSLVEKKNRKPCDYL